MTTLYLTNQQMQPLLFLLSITFRMSSKHCAKFVFFAGGGQLVVFTYEPEMISSFWLTKYFPSFVTDVRSTFVTVPKLISKIQTITGAVVNVLPLPLPHDLSDSFAAVGWARPELYLISSIRNGISSFAKIDTIELNQGSVATTNLLMSFP